MQGRRRHCFLTVTGGAGSLLSGLLGQEVDSGNGGGLDVPCSSKSQ